MSFIKPLVTTVRFFLSRDFLANSEPPLDSLFMCVWHVAFRAIRV